MEQEKLPDYVPNIVKKRYYIRQKIEEKELNITTCYLRNMYNLYDKHFFNLELSKLINLKRVKLKFGYLKGSNVMGMHTYDPNDNSCKISLSRAAFYKLFSNGENRLWVNGLNVRDRLEALQVVFEHELIHMYMVLKRWSNKIKSGKGKMYYSSHGKLFQELSKRYFLHTDYRHQLTSGDSTGHLTRERCSVGFKVYFTDKETKIYGVVIKCNPKRAKVKTVIEYSEIISSVPYPLLFKI